MKVLIEKVCNGYIIKTTSSCDEEEIRVIEEKEDDELYEHESLLFEIMEIFGFSGSKHDEERIFIIRKKRE